MLVEFRLNGELMMVSLVDIVHDGISAVYTFYNTTDRHCSYGTYNILWLIDWAGQLGLKHLYLGYWIEQSRKMAYKQNFLPQEALIDGEWLRLNKPNKK
jgi:arginine-tRNA-protein transferase